MAKSSLILDLDTRAFNAKRREVLGAFRELDRLNDRRLKMSRQIDSYESRNNSTKTKALNLLKAQNREIERGNRLMSKGGAIKSSNSIMNGRSGGMGLGMMGRFVTPLAIGYGLYRGGSAMIRNGVQQQNTLGGIGNMMGGSVSSSFRRQMQDIGIGTGQKSNSVYQAVYDAMSSGFDKDKALEITRVSGKLATGGNYDIATAQSSLITFMTAFKDLSAGRAADLLAGTEVAARATPEEIANAVGEFLPLANNLKASKEEALALYSGVTRSLGNSQEGAIATKALLTAIMQGTPEAKKYGITPGAIEKEGLGGTLNKLAKLLEGKTTDQQAEILGGISPNVRSTSALLSFLGTKGGLSGDVKTIGGSSYEKNFQNQLGNMSVQARTLGTNFEMLSMNVLESSGLMVGLASGMAGVSNVIEKINNMFGLGTETKGNIQDASGVESKQALNKLAIAFPQIAEAYGIDRATALSELASAGSGGKLVNSKDKIAAGLTDFITSGANPLSIIKSIFSSKESIDERIGKRAVSQSMTGNSDLLNSIISESGVFSKTEESLKSRGQEILEKANIDVSKIGDDVMNSIKQSLSNASFTINSAEIIGLPNQQGVPNGFIGPMPSL